MGTSYCSPFILLCLFISITPALGDTERVNDTPLLSEASGQEKIQCQNSIDFIKAETGWLTSPGYDGRRKYGNNLYCVWLFKAQAGKAYEFSFTAIDIEWSPLCYLDHVRIIENDLVGVIKTSKTLLSICGSYDLPHKVATTRSMVKLIFYSDSWNERSGFNVSYRLVPGPFRCNRAQWKCGEVNKCIDKTMLCDGHNDCPNGSDELICPNTTECGKSSIEPWLTNHRIIGGQIGRRGSWPWTVSLRNKSGRHWCGGILIHPKWVLTAAHCLPAESGNSGYSIVAGRYIRNQTDRNEQQQFIDKSFKLDSFEPIYKENDIAVVRLKQPFQMTDYVKMACMPLDRIGESDIGWIVGWGYTKAPGPVSDTQLCCENRQKQASVPVMNKTLCNRFDYYDGRILSHMMCAGYPDGGTDSCEMDSGSPLVRKRIEDEKWEVQGVVSWGTGCGGAKQPGVYTVVHDYIEWVRRTVADNDV